MPISGAHPEGLTSSSGLVTRAVATAGWLGPWVALAALGLWTSEPAGRWLALAALGVVAALWRPRGRGRWPLAGAVFLALVTLFALDGQRRVESVLDDFDAYWAERDTVVGRMLGQRLDRRLSSGLAVTDDLVARWSASEETLDERTMRVLLGRCECSAIALYDSRGDLIIWDGVHRGMVPERVQAGAQQHFYQDLPLFGYLYITSVAPDGSVAMAAHLLRSALPESLGADLGDFATSFYRESGERIRVTAEDPGTTEGIVWDLQGEDRLLSVVVDRPEPTLRARQLMDRSTTQVALLVILAWLVLALGQRVRVEGRVVAAATLLLLAAWSPFERIAGLTPLFDPAAYALPGPIPLSLGRFTLLAVAAFTLAGAMPRSRLKWPSWAAGLAVAVAFPTVLAWASAAVDPDFLAVGRLTWTTYQLGVAALLSLTAGVATALCLPSRGSVWAALAAVAMALGLGAGGAGWVWSTSAHPIWWTALWGVPTALAALGVGAWDGWRRSFVSWGLAVVVGSTAAIPVTWAHRVQARMLVGEERLAGLAAEETPELEGALLRFGALADSLHNAGSDDLGLLYNGWRLSGLADLQHPVWLQIWARDGSPLEGLRMGVPGGEPAPLGEALMESWLSGGVRLIQPNRDDAVQGPAVKGAFDASGQPTRALLGFCQGKGVDVSTVRRVQTPKGEYVEVTVHRPGRPALEVLPELLATAATRLTFPKAMRWLADDTRFARPVRWLVALLDAEVVPVRVFVPLEAGGSSTVSGRPEPRLMLLIPAG